MLRPETASWVRPVTFEATGQRGGLIGVLARAAARRSAAGCMIGE